MQDSMGRARAGVMCVCVLFLPVLLGEVMFSRLLAGTVPSLPPWRLLSPPCFGWWCFLFLLLLGGDAFSSLLCVVVPFLHVLRRNQIY